MTFMKKTIILSVLITLIQINVLSQKRTDANIYGHVINKTTKEHIPYIHISLKGTTIGTSTDATGHYFLKNLPIGKFTIMASGIGYKTLEIEIETLPDKSLEVDFEITEDFLMVEDIVVSANKNEINRKEAPSIVNIISPKLFENTNSVSISQGLNFQPGLRVEINCQNCGFQQLRINGLDGPYSQILIDSRAIFSSLAGVYGLEQIPANMVERVEVMRGGGSALFGSSAIAGTINIITREPSANSFTLSNTSNLIFGKAADINTSFNASLVSDNNKTGLVFFGSTRQRDAFDYDGDGFTELTKIKSQNIGFRGYYKTGVYSKLSFEYHNLGEFRRGGNNIDLPPHESEISEQLNHTINTGGVKYDIFSKNYKHKVNLFTSAQYIERSSYYGAMFDLNAYGKTDDLSVVSGIQYTYSIDTLFFMPATLTVGAEYSFNNLNDQALGYNRLLKQNIDTKSAYIQNEWKNRALSLLIGTRVDKHNLLKEAVLSPRINIRYNPVSDLSLRTSYSTGFRAPQAFDEDLHINITNGNAAIIQIDPDLKKESSSSYSISADYYFFIKSLQANFLIEGFYTRLENVFILEESGFDINGNLILLRKNGSGALVKGINIESKLAPSDKFQFQFGATFQKSEYIEPQQWSENLAPQKRMFRAPNQYGYITTSYLAGKNINISLSGTYTGKMLVQHFAGYVPLDTEKETPDFFDINLKIAYDIPVNGQAKIQLNGGIQNIFNSYQKDLDKGELRDASYIYGPSLPRTYFAGIKFSF
jgi:outer membrane receptor for ferrienterochelin and colicins